jgi:cytochrome c peroxidase
VLLVALLLSLLLSSAAAAGDLSPIEQLGKAILFDTSLSMPHVQSCASCHAPEVGFTGPDSAINAAGAVHAGAVPVRFGNRKPPAAAYAGDSPVLYYDQVDELWIGGMFWDGRATGWTLGDPLAEQAQGPFLNPLEQNMPSAKQVVDAIARSDYADLFLEVWGQESLSSKKDDLTTAYECVARSIAAYERSSEVSAYSSKYDAYLADEAELTPDETLGLELFQGKAMCSACHPSDPGMAGEPPLFTDFSYDNLGVPRNAANPFYFMPPFFNPDGTAWVDEGLGGFLRSAGFAADVFESEIGKVKVPTLRNVDLRPSVGFVKAFGHNGYFKSLEDIVHFYNTRDVEEEEWPAPEVGVNVNTSELGDLGLTPQEEAAVVAFLKTLSDGYTTTAAGPVSAH